MAARSNHAIALFPLITTLTGVALVVVGAVRSASGPSPDRATPEPALVVSLVPLQPAVLPPPVRRVPPGLDLESEERPTLVGVAWSEAWEDRRVVLAHRADERAYAIGDLVPGGDAVVSIARDAVVLSRGDVVVRLDPDGAESVVEDFPLADPWTGAQFDPAAPVDPELEAAVYETLALFRAGDARTAQVAMDALVGAAELIVPYLIRRADSLEPLPAPRVELPDGRVVAPRWEGAVAQAALEAITGQRFGDVLHPDATEAAVIDAARDWRSWLGIGEPR